MSAIQLPPDYFWVLVDTDDRVVSYGSGSASVPPTTAPGQHVVTFSSYQNQMQYVGSRPEAPTPMSTGSKLVVAGIVAIGIWYLLKGHH